MLMDDLVRSVGEQLEIEGDFLRSEAHGSGHINDTFVAVYDQAGAQVRYVHQRLNDRVFSDPEGLMDNVIRVTTHLRHKLTRRGAPDSDRRCLTVVWARDGRPFHVDSDGRYWRTYLFLEGAHSHDTIRGPEQAYEVARAFGVFAQMLVDFGQPPLTVTIPDFHDLGKRFAALEAAVRADACHRLTAVGSEIDRTARWHHYLERALEMEGLAAVPRRIAHNDCKLNNVMLDVATGEGLCVIDLDTVMEGSVLFDFGELVRTGTCTAPEDERNLARMAFDLDLFRALARGYLAGAVPFLTEPETRVLPLAGAALTLENAIRFLTDHLSGDVYFRVHRDGHNLDRCRAQLRLVELMVDRLDAARAAVERIEREVLSQARRVTQDSP
jgi:Ser/Thr protein kinase RdoA (MazF antagonist)